MGEQFAAIRSPAPRAHNDQVEEEAMAGSNEGNEGNEGNAGNVGRSGGGYQVVSDRVDIPFITEGNIAFKRLTETKWRDSSWTGDWYAWLMLVDFARTVDLPYVKPGTLGPKQLWVKTPAETQAMMSGAPNDDEELKRLARLAEDERADALGEIIDQDRGFIGYFMAAMSISPRSHPGTCRLLFTGSLIGAYVSLHFKGLHQRRRPSQRAPALLPPIEVPGHASYPSGHATQARLMAKCVEEALPTTQLKSQLGDVIDTLAARIARNREIAGLHFHSDTVAGRALADDAFAILNSTSLPHSVPTPIPNNTTAPTARRFAQMLSDAGGEWP
jgi:hypothetical protein